VPSTDAGSAPHDRAGVAPGDRKGRQGTGTPLHHPGPVLSSERGGSGSGLDSADGRPAALTALRRVSPFGPCTGYPRVMSGKHRRYVFLRILLDGSRLVPPAVPTRCGENGGPRFGGYLTAVMRRYLPSIPTVGRRPSPWSSTVSRSVSPGSCSPSAPRCAARCRGPRPRFARAGRTRASYRATPGPKVCVRRRT
jgi:hypothetical protein